MMRKLKLLSGFLVMGSTMTTCASVCGAHLANEVNMDKVKMNVSVSTKGETLFLTYEITNENLHSVYIYNVLLGTKSDGEKVVNKNLALIEIKDSIVHVKKDHPEFPSDRLIFALPKRAYVTEVPRQSSFKETIEIKLPLTEWSPYPNSNPPPTTSAVAKGIDFSIAYEMASELTELEEFSQLKVYRVVEKNWKNSATSSAPRRKLLTSPVISMEIPVEIKAAK